MNTPPISRKIRHAFFPLLTASVLLGISPGAQSAAIDLFSTSQAQILDNTGDGTPVSISVGDGTDPSILGGSRDSSVNLIPPYSNNDPLPPTSLDVVGSINYLILTVNALANGTATVQWDGHDNSLNLDKTGLGGIDLTENGTFDAFTITSAFVDHPFHFTIGVYTDETHWAEVTYNGLATDTSVTGSFDFSEFSNCAPSTTLPTDPNLPPIGPIITDTVSVTCGENPVDMTNVGAIQLMVNPDGDTIEIDWIITNFSRTLIHPQVCTADLGDTVWHDLNQNGIQDAGEPGIDGVTVLLKNTAGIVLATTTTDSLSGAAGHYEFTELCAGTYTVEVDTNSLPTNFVASPTEQNSDTTVDSNSSPTTATLTNDNESNPTLDFGYYSSCTGTIGNFVWLDTNRDGIQDSGESGITDITVILTNELNNESTATTDENGFYEFSGLCAGDYSVTVDSSTLPPEYIASPVDAGNPTIDSNPSTSLTTLSAGNSNDPTIDFGYNSACTGKIGNYVWLDTNHDGIQDTGVPGESGIQGVTVKLKTEQNLPIATAITDINGHYVFEGLCANKYRVEVISTAIIADYTASPSIAGTNTAIDSNVNDDIVTLDSNTTEDLTIDFGYSSACTGNIGNYVWLDTNEDGLQNPGEPGIAGVSIDVKDTQNTVIATTTTDSSGLYQFTGFCKDTYTVVVNPLTLPAGLSPTGNKVGSDTAVDSNGSPTETTLDNDNPSDLSLDFGYFPNLILGETCFVCDGKVSQLTLQYNGTSTAHVVVEQADGSVVFDASVAPGGHFILNGVDKKGTLGTLISISVDDNAHATLHTSCSVEIGPGTLVGDFVVIQAYSRNNGLMCPVDGGNTPPPADDCQLCDGKVTQLTMRYNGLAEALVVVTEKGKKGKSGTEVFNATVQPNAQFTFTGTDKKGTLGTEISFTVDGILNTQMHTSCSVEIGPGYIGGAFEVIEAYSRNGGQMCAI